MEVLLTSSQPVIKQPLILAVDDDQDSLFLVTEVLRGNNLSCITATDANTALSLAQLYQPNLILLDILLPDLNGTEVVRCLKKNPQTQSIPVVAVTALAKQEDGIRIMAAGCDDYITKPYMLEDLENLIFHYLDRTAALV